MKRARLKPFTYGLIILFTVHTCLAAQPLVLRTPEMDPTSFRGLRRTFTHTDVWAEKILYGENYKKSESQVIQKLAEAQKAFLNNSPEEARTLFLNLILDRFKHSWKKETREAFVYALMRLAQLSKAEDAEKWLSSAISFDPDVDISASLFPPPLLEKYQELKQKLLSQTVLWPPRLNQYDTIFIDGRQQRLRPESLIALLPGEHRIEILSPAYEPIVRVSQTEDLRLWFPMAGAQLLGGSCEQPRLSEQFVQSYQISLEQTIIGIYSAECVQKYSQGVWQRDGEEAKTNLDLRATQEPAAGDLAVFSAMPKIESKRWYENKWVWIVGGSVVLGALAYSLSASRGSDGGGQTTIERPVHR